MIAGRLSERVAFDAPNGTTDDFGGVTVAWAEVFQERARFIYAKGDESVQAARQAGRYAFKVHVRASAQTRALTTDHRMREARDGTIWNITEVDARSEESRINRVVYLVVEGPVVR